MKNKKRLLALTLITLFGSLLFTSCDNYVISSSSTAPITIDDARRIATRNAGTTVEATNITVVEQEKEDGVKYFDIEFTIGSTKYEYDISLVDGSIINVEVNDTPVRTEDVTTYSAEADPTYISVDEAKTAALTHAEVTVENATFIETVLDYEDGKVVYDVEFVTTEKEYEYEIDAITGSVVKNNFENINNNTSNSTGTYIGVEAAKTAALTHANVDAANATFVEAKLDTNHGIYVYEIEFRAGGNEYEYEINAANGAIIEVDVERD